MGASGSNSPPSHGLGGQNTHTENSFDGQLPNADISSVTNVINALAAIRTHNTSASSGNVNATTNAGTMNQTSYKENMKMQRS